jgi:hypothetical protein
MATQTKVTADLSQLEELLKQIGGEYVTRVGILGSDAGTVHDAESGLTNSQLGVIQEFGSESRNIPARSFLRMPLETKQKELVDSLGSGMVKDKMEKGDIQGIYRLLGEVGAGIVREAFPTSGYGNWQPNAPSTIAKKGSSKPLIDTGVLSRSITYDVVKKSEI